MKNKDRKYFSALEQARQNFSRQLVQQPVDNNNYEQLLKTLIQNTFAQTAYTPQAKQYLQSRFIDYYQKPTNYSPVNPALPRGAAGAYWNNPQGGNIVIDANLLKSGNPYAVEVLRHEFNHALDSNVNNQQQIASYMPQGPNSANSSGFYQGLQQQSPQSRNNINQFLMSYPNDAGVKDQEGFAQYGIGGNMTLLNPMGSYYKNIYAPVSRVPLNYSPVFRSPENQE